MNPAEIKKTRLYRTLAPCVRKEDRDELARMLAMVRRTEKFNDDGIFLISAFVWCATPQGQRYWQELNDRLRAAGFDCG